jgi:DNA topoisomerase IB
MTRLRRSDCSEPGITRRRSGRGFAYFEADGERITERDVIERINALGIPPAWRDVWICSRENGHLQATGTDAAGRKQYRYHDAWRMRRDAQKFEDMTRFAKALPRLREQVEADLTATDH